MSETVSVDIRHQLVLALGVNKFLREEIDNIYNKDKWKYYEYYKNSGMFDDMVKRMYSASKQEYINKVIGIVEYSYSIEDFEYIYYLIKKGYKFAYNHFKNNKHNGYISLDTYRDSLMKKRNNDVREMELLSNEFVLIWLCTKENINVTGDIVMGLVRKHVERQRIQCRARYYRELTAKEDDKEMLSETLPIMYDMYKLTKKDLKGKNFDLLLETAIEGYTLEKLYDKYNMKAPHIVPKAYFKTRSDIFNEGLTKYIGAYSQWFKILGFTEDVAGDVDLSEDDIKLILSEFDLAKKYNNLDESDRKVFSMSLFYIFMLAKMYKELENKYLNESKEETYSELLKKEEYIKEKEEYIAKEEKEYKDNIQSRDNRIEELERYVASLEQENRKLKDNVDKYKDDFDELHKLREFVYSDNEDEDVEYEETSIVEKAENIEKHNIAIIGGHPNFINKFKTVCPSIVSVDIDKINVDFNFLKKMDYVFIHTNYLSHKLYYKVMDMITDNNISYDYIRGVNIDKNIDYIDGKLNNI